MSEAFRNEDLGWHDSDGDRGTVEPCAPLAFDAATAVAFALDAVIRGGGDTNDGELLKEKLLSVEFDGLSGRVSFSDSGDRSFTKYSVFNQKGGGGSAVKRGCAKNRFCNVGADGGSTHIPWRDQDLSWGWGVQLKFGGDAVLGSWYLRVRLWTQSLSPWISANGRCPMLLLRRVFR